MKPSAIRHLLFVAAGLVLPASHLAAQSPPVVAPQVIVVGRGEVDVKPDRARLEFSVETRALTAAAAAAENSKRQRAVLDTLQRLGISAEQLQTASLQVTPEMAYPGKGEPPKVTGYVARNSVRVEVLKLEQTGILVDAALAKGSNSIMGLQFYSSKAAEGRREALSRAVSAARLDAEAMVKAAGYQLGTLVEISNGARSETPAMYATDMALSARMVASPAPTPVSPGELKFSEVVTVRWLVKQ